MSNRTARNKHPEEMVSKACAGDLCDPSAGCIPAASRNDREPWAVGAPFATALATIVPPIVSYMRVTLVRIGVAMCHATMLYVAMGWVTRGGGGTSTSGASRASATLDE